MADDDLDIQPIKGVNLEKKLRTLSLRVDEQLAMQIQSYCIKNNLDKSKGIRELIIQGIQSQTTTKM